MPEHPDADLDPDDPAVIADDAFVEGLSAGFTPPSGDEAARILAGWRDEARDPAIADMHEIYDDPRLNPIAFLPADAAGTVSYGGHVDRVAPARREFTGEDGAVYARPHPDEFASFDDVDSTMIVDDGGPQ